MILFVSLIFWMLMALSDSEFYLRTTQQRQPGVLVRPSSPRNQVPRKRPSVFGSALNALTGERKHKKKEGDLPGCVRPLWQASSFPTCNDVHGVDLRKAILQGMRERSDKKRSVVGYVSSGLWRSVFAVSTGDEKEVSVLKMMKAKHDLTPRNFDRHRRDAVVMERLVGNPNVVDIYGFCGNSVLTEYASQTVEDLLYGGADRRVAAVGTIKHTPEAQLELAVGVMQGIAALAEVKGGPIVHADITAKQFLISKTGQIKLNDFNRCRFMAHHRSDGSPCKFVIPTSPGKNRSPEEYKEDYLDEKLDVYSGGNILYGILTGTKAWYQNGSTETKKYVMRGIMPYIPDELRKPNTFSAALVNLTELALENDPEQRMSAREIVKGLEELRDRFFSKAP
jgi:serine/threonine protein kinase